MNTKTRIHQDAKTENEQRQELYASLLDCLKNRASKESDGWHHPKLSERPWPSGGYRHEVQLSSTDTDDDGGVDQLYLGYGVDYPVIRLCHCIGYGDEGNMYENEAGLIFHSDKTKRKTLRRLSKLYAEYGIDVDFSSMLA